MQLKQAKVLTILASAVLFGSAHSAVYVVPSDIDQYKQKTDQSFYDMYQNPNSALGKSVNPNAKPYTDTISTNQRIMEGYTVPFIKQPSAQGSSVIDGTTINASILGKPITINYTKDGIQISGSDVSVKGSVVEAYQHLRDGDYSGGKYGTTDFNRYMRKALFDASTGIITVIDYRDHYHRDCGKYGCTDYQKTGSEFLSADQQAINLHALVKGNWQQDLASYASVYKNKSEKELTAGLYVGKGVNGGNSNNNGGNGKYGA